MKRLDFEKSDLICCLLSGVLLAAGVFAPLDTAVKSVLLFVCAAVSGYTLLLDTFEAVKEKQMTESVLSLIAVTAAFIIGEYTEGAAIALFFRIGEMLEEWAEGRSRRAVEEVCSLVSDTVFVKTASGAEQVNAADVKIGTEIVVYPNSPVALDCVVTSGVGHIDCSALTGESLPVEVCEGSEIKSGCINLENELVCITQKLLEDSSASRIVRLVEEAAEKKSRTQSTVSRFAAIYTPIVTAAALALALIMSLVTGEPSKWIMRGLVLLVASCPCAVVLSAPLAFFAGMGGLAKKGVIVKGSCYVEALSRARCAVFDKTGTLTTGNIKVSEVIAVNPYSSETVLEYAAACEYASSHPLAKAVCAEYGKAVQGSKLYEIPGLGTGTVYGGKNILCGGKRLMERENVDVSALPESRVYVAVNGKAAGSILFEDELRADCAQTINELKTLGITETVMLTGDSEEKAKSAASACLIDSYKSSLLPDEKLACLEEIMNGGKNTIYCGDGINDAPCLALADTGAAMGLGTRAASEAADIILVNSSLKSLVTAVKHSKKIMRTVRFNIVFSLGFKLAVMVLGVLGLAPVWAAVAADVGTLIVAVLISSLLLKVEK